MARSIFKGGAILGVAGAVPSARIDNLTDHAFATEEEARKVITLTGVPEYRKASPGTTASDLCEAAARQLMSGLDESFDSIDAIVFVSMTPDYRVPSTACTLQHRLGCRTSTIAFDINMGCSGYIVGLFNALSLIQGAGLRRVLLLTGDTQTKLCHFEDKNVAFILADAGTASLVGASASAEAVTVELMTDGSRYKSLYVPAGGFRTMTSPATREVSERADGGMRSDEHLYMNGMDVFKFSSTDVVDLLASFLAQGGLAPAQINNLFLHQANKFMTDKIAAKLKFTKEQVPYSLGVYGNTGSASIPLTIAHHFSQHPMAGPTRNLLCGFGVGLSWGVIDMVFQQLFTPPVIDFA